MRYPKIFIVMVMMFFLSVTPHVQAQDFMQERVSQLEARVNALQEYMQTLETTLNNFSNTIIDNLDMRLRSATDKVVVLNPISRKFNKIVTNAGDFLIAVDKMEKLTQGRRLHLRIGNPAATTYTGVTLRIKWGKKWDKSLANRTYTQWRQSLRGAEYSYPGELPAGSWTEVVVDLVPASYNIAHIECEMEVEKINLK